MLVLFNLDIGTQDFSEDTGNFSTGELTVPKLTDAPKEELNNLEQYTNKEVIQLLTNKIRFVWTQENNFNNSEFNLLFSECISRLQDLQNDPAIVKFNQTDNILFLQGLYQLPSMLEDYPMLKLKAQELHPEIERLAYTLIKEYRIDIRDLSQARFIGQIASRHIKMLETIVLNPIRDEISQLNNLKGTYGVRAVENLITTITSNAGEFFSKNREDINIYLDLIVDKSKRSELEELIGRIIYKLSNIKKRN